VCSPMVIVVIAVNPGSADLFMRPPSIRGSSNDGFCRPATPKPMAEPGRAEAPCSAGWPAICARRWRSWCCWRLVIVAIGAAPGSRRIKTDPRRGRQQTCWPRPGRNTCSATDDLGREHFLAGLIYGAPGDRFLCQPDSRSAFAVAIGLPVGLAAGFFRRLDRRYHSAGIIDTFLSFPAIVLAIAVNRRARHRAHPTA